MDAVLGTLALATALFFFFGFPYIEDMLLAEDQKEGYVKPETTAESAPAPAVQLASVREQSPVRLVPEPDRLAA